MGNTIGRTVHTFYARIAQAMYSVLESSGRLSRGGFHTTIALHAVATLAMISTMHLPLSPLPCNPDRHQSIGHVGSHRLSVRGFCLSALLALSCFLSAPLEANDEQLLIFAAASLKPALDELQDAAPIKAINNVRISFAASSQLARQIEHGAPAALFLSADRDWMDYLEKRNLIARNSRVDLLSNRLVLIAPAESTIALELAFGANLASALDIDGRLAIAEPDSVPAGKYAKAALTALGIWPSIQSRTVRAANVRAALNFVARKEASLGIVYRSDAYSEPLVRTVDTFPAATHPPIVYPAAVVQRHDSPTARDLLAALRSSVASDTFRRHGFIVLSTDVGAGLDMGKHAFP